MTNTQALTTATEIVDALNAYEPVLREDGSPDDSYDIWTGLILDIPGYDGDLTDRLDTNYRGDIFATKTDVFEFEAQDDEWIRCDRDSTIALLPPAEEEDEEQLTTATEIVEALNAYKPILSEDGYPVDNLDIWNDVIYLVDGYDGDLTDRLDPDYQSDIFATKTDVFMFVAQDDEWIRCDRDDAIDAIGDEEDEEDEEDED